MGLDMYVYKTKAPPKDYKKVGGYTYYSREVPYDDNSEGSIEIIEGWEGDPKHPDARNYEELHYWRKHPNLHGLIEQIYHGENDINWIEPFNCITMVLERSDIDLIEANLDVLPDTEGFFFGESWWEETDKDGNPDPIAIRFNKARKEGDRDFIKKAREALDEGYYLFYMPSW